MAGFHIVCSQKTNYMHYKESDLIHFDFVPVCTLTTDCAGNIHYINKKGEELLGYRREELVNKVPLTTLIRGQDKIKYDALISELKGKKTLGNIELEVVRRDKCFLHVLLNATGQYGDDGNLLHIITTLTDISSMKVSQSFMRSQELLKQTITDNATVALFMMDDKGYCTFMNPAAEALTGFTFEEIKAKQLHYMIHHKKPDGSDYPIEECPIDRALPENFDVRAHEDLFIRKDGEFIPVSCAASPIFENGRPVSTVIEVRDLRQQKAHLKEIEKKSESLEILNSIGKIINGELDLQTVLQTVTDASTKLTGAAFGAFFYNAISDKGESYMLYTLSGAPKEAFEKFGMPRNTQVFNHTFSGLGIVRVDDITADPRYGKNAPHYGMPKGHLPVVSYLAVPVIAKSGEVIGGLFFGHPEKGVFSKEIEDIVAGIASQASIAIENARLFNDLRKVNEENQKLLQISIESEKKKDEFMGIASHELKTPLTSMKAYTQLIVKTVKEGDYTLVPRYIQKAEEGVLKLERLVNDLLDVSKIESGKLELNFNEFDFIELADTCIENFSLIEPTAKIVRNGISSAIVCGDKERLEQVLINLVSKAIKYSPKEREVKIEIKEKDEMLQVEVIDRGIGLPADKTELIFNRFYRVQEKVNKVSGLGIGLYISRQIIMRHQGTIGVTSKEGEGSTFYFSIPLKHKK